MNLIGFATRLEHANDLLDDTGEFGMNAVEAPVHVCDFHATILHLIGLDHEHPSYPHAGLDVHLTGVEHAHVMVELLA